MTMSRISFRTRVGAAIVLAVSTLISGCGDSSGPGTVDARGALQSLALGLADAGGGIGSGATPDVTSALPDLIPVLTQANVTINGASQTMFGLGLRETFPAGTCEETLFPDPFFPAPPGECTPPQLGTVLVLWQSHSALERPDRMLIVAADVGTSDFDYSTIAISASPSPSQLPTIGAFALYLQGEDELWSSLSGSLTTAVAGLNQSCNLPLPPYAKSGACSVADFDEQGQIVFEPFTLDQPDNRRLTIGIPRQTLKGLWLNITEVQAVSYPRTANRGLRGMVASRLGALATRVAPTR